MRLSDLARVDSETKRIYGLAGCPWRHWTVEAVDGRAIGEFATLVEAFDSLREHKVEGHVRLRATLGTCTRPGDNWDVVPNLPCPHGVEAVLRAGIPTAVSHPRQLGCKGVEIPEYERAMGHPFEQAVVVG